MRILRQLALPLAGAVLCSAAAAQSTGPDVTVSHVGSFGSDYAEFGLNQGFYSYAMATTSCNRGDTLLEWLDSGPLFEHHPVIAQQAYRLKDGILEQIGYAWLKHGFCAADSNACGPCQNAGTCDYLGLGCSDLYGSGLNSGGLRDRWSVDVASGTHNDPSVGASGVHAGRVMIAQADVANPGAQYFFEAQYVAGDDSEAGNHANNVSWREVSFNNPTSVVSVGNTVEEQVALLAWVANDPFAAVDQTIVPDEGGVGVHGIFNVGYRATDNGNGTWHYEYTVHNQTSGRAAGSFSVPIPAGVVLTNVGFHDVNHHSGSIWDSTDWTWTVSGGEITWTVTQDFGTNPNANAIRWGMMYNFRFDANTTPGNASATVGIFEPGVPNEINTSLRAPSAPTEPGAAFCYGDGSGTACPCGNESGVAGRGCEQSNGLGMDIAGFGTNSVAADDFGLDVTQIAPSNTGIFYCGTVPISAPLYDGVQCVSGDVRRFGGLFQLGGSVQSSGFVAQEGTGFYFLPGTTYNFQYWSRDVAAPGPCGTGANFSPGYAITMAP